MTLPLELFVLHGSPYAWRVELALEHKGLAYEKRVLSLSNGELATPEFRALSPRGKVPVLRAGDYVLTESFAILAFLERLRPEPPLFGVTPEETGRIWSVVSDYTAYVDPHVESFILPIYFGEAEARADEVRAAAEALTRELASYDRALARSPFLAGTAVTAADFVVFPAVQSIARAASKPAARAFDLPFVPVAARHPAVAAWCERIERLPGYERTYPPNWR